MLQLKNNKYNLNFCYINFNDIINTYWHKFNYNNLKNNNILKAIMNELLGYYQILFFPRKNKSLHLDIRLS